MLINQYCDVKENEQDLTMEEARQINEMCLKRLQRYNMKCFMSLNCLNLKSIEGLHRRQTPSDI